MSNCGCHKLCKHPKRTICSFFSPFFWGGLDNFRTVAVRAGTDPAIVEKLQSAVEESVASAEWQTFCAETYSCIQPVTGEEAQAMIRDFLQLITDQLAS